MALPSPVAQFPDMSGVISEAQRRAAGLVDSANMWMGRFGTSNQGSQVPQQESSILPTDPSDSLTGISAYGSEGGGRAGTNAKSGSIFSNLLAQHEGGGRYDTLFGHSQKEGGRFAGVDVSKMTIGQALEFANPSGEYGQWVKQRLAESGQNPRVATPMGRGQIVGSTLSRAVQQLGLGMDTPFNAQTQDMIIDHLARQRLSGQSSMAGKRQAMRAEWEGFKHVPDTVLDQAILQFENQWRA